VSVTGLVITWVTITAVGSIAIADLCKVQNVIDNAKAVHVPLSWLPMLGILKLAGALGLAVGLAGIEPIGVAAGAGLVGFFAIAVGAHVRAHVLHNIAFPGFYLALAIGSLVSATSQL
jgi:hypothetical protein